MKNKNVLKKKEKFDCGNCIFCLSKCPECGSRNIRVRFRPEFEYSFEEDEESIDISYNDDLIQIHCEDCDSYTESYNSLLTVSIDECLGLTTGVNVTRNEDRTIDIRPYRITAAKE